MAAIMMAVAPATRLPTDGCGGLGSVGGSAATAVDIGPYCTIQAGGVAQFLAGMNANGRGTFSTLAVALIPRPPGADPRAVRCAVKARSPLPTSGEEVPGHSCLRT